MTLAYQDVAISDALRRVKGEYLEMPGLRLTPAQAQRLWGLDRESCQALLGRSSTPSFSTRREMVRSA